ncbi:MAG: glycoside hydrolase family 1 protein [Bacillota bacterium]|nr:glycoside hydrolase family 1 protein [Bacillota bacterium]
MQKKFLWGASTSGFQVEGGFNEGGKGLSTTDVRHVPEGIADTKVASDHYHHVEEDILLMKELGLTVYRFSFCWARIMPDGHTVNEEGLAFYDKIIQLCFENGIEPLPTLYHFEMPQALVEEFGGWKDRRCVDAYVAYAKICFTRWKGVIKHWVTINEQLIAMAAGDLNGNHEPNKFLQTQYMYQMSYHASIAEKIAIQVLREIDDQAQIGPVCAVQNTYPKSSSPEDVLAAMDAEELMMYMLLDMSVKGEYSPRVKHLLKEMNIFPHVEEGDEVLLKSSKPDFIGINYYSSICVKNNEKGIVNYNLPPFFRSSVFDICKNEHIRVTEWMTNGIDAIGIRSILYKIYNRYGLPMIITENGMAYSDELIDGKINDMPRIEYLSLHIKEVLKAREEGYPIFGYCPWSFIDVVSSHQGFAKRYGLVYVDRTDTDIKSCERIRKDSYYWYQNVIKTDGKNL